MVRRTPPIAPPPTTMLEEQRLCLNLRTHRQSSGMEEAKSETCSNNKYRHTYNTPTTKQEKAESNTNHNQLLASDHEATNKEKVGMRDSQKRKGNHRRSGGRRGKGTSI